MKVVIHLSVLSLALGAVGASRAADRELTLDAAVAIATATAPQLQARQAMVEAAQDASVSAGRLPDPALVAGVDNLPSNGVDAWSSGRDFMTMRKIGLMQSFPNSRKRQSEQAVAQAMVRVAESQSRQSQLEIAQAVAQAWISRLAAELSVTRLQELRSVLALQLELAGVAVASGRASASDALSVQAAAADLDDRLLEARRESAATSAELARWLGADADRPLATPPSFTELPGSAAELLGSLHHHAALQAYDSRIAAARSEIAVASAARRPDWSAELDYGRRGPGYSDMVSVQFQVALPLFPGTRQDPAIHARRAAVRQLEAEKQDALRMHTAEITSMLNDWQSAKERIALYERERLPLAHQRADLALADLRAGRMELRQALAVLSERIDVERSYVELVKALGKSWAYLRYLPTQGEVR
jgi:outer membrane protein TolC